MADKNLITLAPCGATSRGMALTGRMTIGSAAANGRPPAFRSFPQRLSPRQPRPGYEAGPRQDHDGNPDVDAVAVGATPTGRPRSRTGALRVGPAISVDLAIRFGWLSAMRLHLARAATRGDRT